MYLLITFQIIYATVIMFAFFQKDKMDELLYDDSIPVSIFVDPSIDQKEYFNFINELSVDFDIPISKYVYREDNKLIVFTTNSSLNGKVKLKNGNYISENDPSTYFLSTSDSNNDKQIGTIKQPVSSREIMIKDFREVNNFGLNGMYTFNSQNVKQVNKMVKEINKQYGEAKIETSIGSVANEPDISVVVNLAIISIFIFISVVYYFISQFKMLSVKKINGYSIFDLQMEFINQITKVFSIAAITVYVFSFLYFLVQRDFDYFLNFTLVYVIIIIMDGLFLLLPTCLLTLFINKIDIIGSIKGKKPYKLTTTLNYFTKILFTILIIVVIDRGLENYDDLNGKLEQLNDWERTENIFKTVTKYNGQTDLKQEQKSNQRLKQFYIDIEEELGAFVIDSSNYSEDGNTYLYEDYPECEEFPYKPNCEAITVNFNYFKHNPIHSINGNIKEQMEIDDKTLNLLVPEKYKKIEKQLIPIYKEYFHFRKVEVENIYNEEIGLPLNDTKMKDLDVNIIYVRNNQTYFTFDIDKAKLDNNVILDPITIVDTGNFDASDYSSYISSSLYFESNPNDGAFENLNPYIQKYGLESTLQSVDSLYEEYGKEINDIRTEQKQILKVLSLLILSNIVITYYIISIYYERNKIGYFIKKINGYNFLDNIKNLLLILFILNFISTVIGSLVSFSADILIIMFGMLLVELFITLLISKRIARKTINSVIKGG